MSYYYRRKTWAFALYTFVMCLSRVVVGVHYPSDVLGGALIGTLCASCLIYAQVILSKKFSVFDLSSEVYGKQAGLISKE
jgi:undecaprenyl-diphosphatase